MSAVIVASSSNPGYLEQEILSKPTCSTKYPRLSDPFLIVSNYIKWVTTSWTHSTKVYRDRAKTPG